MEKQVEVVEVLVEELDEAVLDMVGGGSSMGVSY